MTALIIVNDILIDLNLLNVEPLMNAENFTSVGTNVWSTSLRGNSPKFLRTRWLRWFLSNFVGNRVQWPLWWVMVWPWPKWLKQPRFPARNTQPKFTSTNKELDFLFPFWRLDIFRLTLVGDPRPWFERFWTEISLDGAAVLGLLLLSPCGQNHYWLSNWAIPHLSV